MYNTHRIAGPNVKVIWCVRADLHNEVQRTDDMHESSTDEEPQHRVNSHLFKYLLICGAY